MSNEISFEHIIPTLEDFYTCGWKDVIASARGNRLISFFEPLRKAASDAAEQGRLGNAKVLSMLANASSMILNPNSFTTPYNPLMVMGGKRSAIPDDYLTEEINYLARIVGEIDDFGLKARIADIVWLRQEKREVRFALMAIDAFREISLNDDLQGRDVCRCWDRAFYLVRILKGGAGERYKDMESKVIDAILCSRYEDSYKGKQLADLLKKYGLGRASWEAIAEKLSELGLECYLRGDLYQGREYFQISANWYNSYGNLEKAVEMKVAYAEGYEHAAKVSLVSTNPSNMVAASFFEMALQIYKTIPRKERHKYKVDDRIAELNTDLECAGKRSLEEMTVISSGEIDISASANAAIDAVKGKNPVEALHIFANLDNGPNCDDIRNNVLEKIKSGHISLHFQQKRMSIDGRVVAIRPGLNLHDASAKENEIVIKSEMIHEFMVDIHVLVSSVILPAQNQLLQEHRFSEADFIEIASNSPVVPEGREHLFGKALFLGYDRDFASSMHLLIPQIENMVRYFLKKNGIKTTTLASDGIETENGLSSLMALPETEQILGKNFSFGINSLFCDAFGPNLRNELAHGLLNDVDCNSRNIIYAWWYMFKVVFNTFYRANYSNGCAR